MTIIQLIFIVLLGTVIKADDQSLFNLRGADESNVVTVCCLNTGKSCDGVLLSKKWVLLRASCIFPRDPDGILVFRKPGANCAQLDGLPHQKIRRASAVYNHPKWSADIAMIPLDVPYAEKVSEVDIEDDDDLKMYETWVNEIINSHTDKKSPITPLPRALEHPGKSFLFAIVLPSFTFVLFFIYFIFYTGNSTCKATSKTYKSIKYEKMDTTF